MNRYTRVMIFAFVGALCAVLLAYADEDKYKPFDDLESELAELASEHKEVKKECWLLRQKVDVQKKIDGSANPLIEQKKKDCKDFLKLIRKTMKDVQDKIDKEDEDNSDSDDDDDD